MPRTDEFAPTWEHELANMLMFWLPLAGLIMAAVLLVLWLVGVLPEGGTAGR